MPTTTKALEGKTFTQFYEDRLGIPRRGAGGEMTYIDDEPLIDPDSIELPAVVTKGLSGESIEAMKANVAMANQGLETSGVAFRASMAALSRIRSDLMSVKKKRNWTALTESKALGMSGRMARDLVTAWDTWVKDTDVSSSILVKISPRTLAKIGTADAGKRTHAVNKMKKDEKVTESDLGLITKPSGKKISFDDLIAKAKDKASGMSDEEKLEAFADILRENLKLKQQIAELKAKK
jgi:hypothetical protein